MTCRRWWKTWKLGRKKSRRITGSFSIRSFSTASLRDYKVLRRILTPRFDPFRPFTFFLCYICSDERLFEFLWRRWVFATLCSETDINEGAPVHGGKRPKGGKIISVFLQTFLPNSLYLSLVSPANISGRKSKPVSMNMKKWTRSWKLSSAALKMVNPQTPAPLPQRWMNLLPQLLHCPVRKVLPLLLQ